MLTDRSDDRESPGPDRPAAASDRRAGRRHQSVLLVGKVRRAGVESACLVHDISTHGLMARFTVAPEIGEALEVEVRGLPPITGVVRWLESRKAGLHFGDAQPVDKLFQLKRADGLIARPPRFPLETRAALRVDGERFDADTLDISAGGVKLAVDRPVTPGQAGQVLLPGTEAPPLFGKVCWADGGQFGFRFMTPLPLDVLGRILAR